MNAEQRQKRDQIIAIENVAKAIKTLTTEVSNLSQKFDLLLDKLAQDDQSDG